MAIGKTNAGGGGSSGATLTITGVVGATVTVSKDGKTYTRTINNSGTAVFKGLSTGTWTVTMSGNGQTTTRTVEIVADYSLTIAYFSATITITYPANSTCVVTDSSGATIASDTNTGTAAKTWTATVGATGTYTITATATDGSGKTKSTTVSITANGQVETVELAYDYVIFDSTDGLNATYSDGGGGATVTVSTSGGVKVLTFPDGGGYNRMAYLTPAVDVTEFNTLKISAFASADRKFALWNNKPNSYETGIVASVVIKQGTSPSAYAIDVSKLSGSYYLGTQYAGGDTTVYDLRFE